MSTNMYSENRLILIIKRIHVLIGLSGELKEDNAEERGSSGTGGHNEEACVKADVTSAGCATVHVQQRTHEMREG